MNKVKKEFRLCYLVLGIILIISAIILVINIASKKELNKNGVSKSYANFKIHNIKVTKGKEVNVEIELLNDSDFVAANFEYKYDGDSLEYINYEIGESLKDGAMTIVNNDDKNKKILIGFVAKPDGEKTIKAGKIIDIKFKVKETLTKNKIENTFDCTTLKKEDGTDINSNIQQGTIEINDIGGVTN